MNLPANSAMQPAAMAIPKEGYFEFQQGRYGPIFPQTPSNYGFTIIAKIKPGATHAIRAHGKVLEKIVRDDPHAFATLPASLPALGPYSISRTKPTSCTRASSTPISTNIPKMPSPCSLSQASIRSSKTWRAFPLTGTRTSRPSSSLFATINVRAFSNTAEYPFVTAAEIKKALNVKHALSAMLDQAQ